MLPKNLMTIAAGLASGLLFGVGLAVAGMTNPNKILNFLDLTHGWDPSLAFVMAGAIPMSAIAFRIGRRHPQPLLSATFALPAKARIEPALLIGSALFGLGWGLGGYCPGPAVASLSRPNAPLLGFLLAMGLGLVLAPALRRWSAKSGRPSGSSVAPTGDG